MSVPYTANDRIGYTVDYCELNVIDLNKLSTPEGKAEMAALARDAMRDVGFFYLVNHGLTRAEVMHSIAAGVLLKRLSDYSSLDRSYIPDSRCPVLSGI